MSHKLKFKDRIRKFIAPKNKLGVASPVADIIPNKIKGLPNLITPHRPEEEPAQEKKRKTSLVKTQPKNKINQLNNVMSVIEDMKRKINGIRNIPNKTQDNYITRNIHLNTTKKYTLPQRTENTQNTITKIVPKFIKIPEKTLVTHNNTINSDHKTTDKVVHSINTVTAQERVANTINKLFTTKNNTTNKNTQLRNNKNVTEKSQNIYQTNVNLKNEKAKFVPQKENKEQTNIPNTVNNTIIKPQKDKVTNNTIIKPQKDKVTNNTIIKPQKDKVVVPNRKDKNETTLHEPNTTKNSIRKIFNNKNIITKNKMSIPMVVREKPSSMISNLHTTNILNRPNHRNEAFHKSSTVINKLKNIMKDGKIQIPALYAGGVVNSPILAKVGDATLPGGKSDPEMVTPISKVPEILAKAKTLEKTKNIIGKTTTKNVPEIANRKLTENTEMKLNKENSSDDKSGSGNPPVIIAPTNNTSVRGGAGKPSIQNSPLKVSGAFRNYAFLPRWRRGIG